MTRRARLGQLAGVLLLVSRGAQAQSLPLRTSTVPAIDSTSGLVTTVTGSRRKATLGYVTAQVDVAEALRSAPATSLHDLLNARVPGLLLTSGSQVGTGARIRVRGVSSAAMPTAPIWVIDGIRMVSDNDDMAYSTGGNNPGRAGDINPDDVEQIEVLKGLAATTLYGTDGASGVIVITTKRARAGAPRWTAFTEGGVSTDENNYPTAYSLWGKRAGQAVSSLSGCTLTLVASNGCTADSLTSLNVMREPALSPLRAGFRRQVGVAVSGGGNAFRYRVTVEDESVDGVLALPTFERDRMRAESETIHPWTERPNVMGRRSLRANVSSDVTTTLHVDVSLGLTDVAQRFAWEGDRMHGVGAIALLGPGTRNNGAVPGRTAPLAGYASATPGAAWQSLLSQDVRRTTWVLATTWRPTAWWSTRLTAGTDGAVAQDEQRNAAGEGPPSADFIIGRRGVGRTEHTAQTLEGITTAQYSVLGMSAGTSIGVQRIVRRDTRSLVDTAGWPSIGGPISSASTANKREVTGGFAEQRFAWRDRLHTTFAVRRDAQKTLGFAAQPVSLLSAAAAYDLLQQRRIDASSWRPDVRLRYAYGVSGPSTTTNAAFQAERYREHELGVDLQMLRGRIGADATYYNKRTSDALFEVQGAPILSGASVGLQNIGVVKNTGAELRLSGALVRGRRFAWDVTVLSSQNTNTVASLESGVSLPFGNATQTRQGYPIRGYWQLPLTGWKDKNGDGILVPSADSARNEVFVGPNAVYRGAPTPTSMTTVVNTWLFANRAIRVQTLWDRRAGGLAFNRTEARRCRSAVNCDGVTRAASPLAEQAAAVALNQFGSFDGYLVPGDFVRLREASVAITLSPSATRLVTRGRALTVVLAARNLAVWTRYRGVDPEAATALTRENMPSPFGNSVGTEAPADDLVFGPPRTITLRLVIGN